VTAIASASTRGNNDANVLAAYLYNGAGRLVVEDFVQPDVRLDLWGQTAGTYAGFDRFGRVVQQLWRDYGASEDRDKFIYTYDRNSNRTSKDLTLVAGEDEKYTYDNLNRLTAYDRGTLSGGNITSKVRNEAWGLTPTGNWNGYQVDADGDGNYTDATDLDQDRTHNLVNEITGISEQADPAQTAWADPAYNARGNMTSGPKPGAETTTNKYIYDAWNRMVKVTDASDVTIAEYRYDGRNYRIAKLLPNGNNWDRTDSYYNGAWQCLEERYGANQAKETLPTNTKFRWVWSVQYIDAPVLRWRDTDLNGTLDETLYYCNDANMNVTALINTDGSVAERYVYDPYGKVTIYDDDWSDTVSWANSKQNEILYCGYRFDNESGLYGLRERYYHWLLGCLTTWDPIVVGPNKYQYVDSCPTMWTDPFGLGTPGTAVEDYKDCGFTREELNLMQQAPATRDAIVEKCKSRIDLRKSGYATPAGASVANVGAGSVATTATGLILRYAPGWFKALALIPAAIDAYLIYNYWHVTLPAIEKAAEDAKRKYCVPPCK